jgi:hypothetical protein
MNDQLLRLEYVDPSTLGTNPANWRRHPEAQRAAYAQLLAEVGWVAPLVFNEDTGRLIDGHMRLDDAIARGLPAVPVAIGRWTEGQERKILAALDPIGAMAVGDARAYAELLATLDDASGPLMELLAGVADDLGGFDTGPQDLPPLPSLAAATPRGDRGGAGYEPPRGGAAQPADPAAGGNVNVDPETGEVLDALGEVPAADGAPDTVWPSTNEWGVPDLLLAKQADAVDWPVNQWGTLGMNRPMPGTWCFYIDDHRFEPLWDKPENATRSGAVAIVEPNFSTHQQHARAYVLWQTYRKRWLARYWQSQGLKVFVDLNVWHEFRELNLLGVPRGWKAYANRAHRGEDHLIADWELACEHAGTDDILYLVYSGGKDVKELAARRGWFWVPDQYDEAKGRYSQPQERQSE